ncbi:hypothetical protein O2K51_14270 [Apibacter raozihei]|uniref:hypothetical protein n=1 Tax=Apibacter raozihei TaxID=2500547 RepID=UPI000FE3F6A6|nr:hypothetical protein [Apibacter raozihei]
MNTFKISSFTFLLLSIFLFSCGEKSSTNPPKDSLNSSLIENESTEEQSLPISDLQLSSSQDQLIKEIYQKYRGKFEEVGRNRNITGYEKGVRKRELAYERKEEILKILNAEQRKIAENWSGDVNDQNNDYLESQLETLENSYKVNKNNIENNTNLSKEEKKLKKEELENQYKIDRKKLKSRKDIIKDSHLTK